MIVYQPPPHTGLEILYHDSSILVVSKPAGLLSVPGRGAECQDCLISRVQLESPEALIVHRLDMSTSGLMVMALNSSAQRHLNRQFEQRQVEKSYLAVVCGQIEPTEGIIDLPLICDWPNRPRQIVDHDNGKPSKTHYRVRGYNSTEETTHVELKPVTGRTHQLRVHMQALGHPILGDDLYAEDDILKRADRLLLHAESLVFTHPVTLKSVAFRQQAPF